MSEFLREHHNISFLHTKTNGNFSALAVVREGERCTVLLRGLQITRLHISSYACNDLPYG